MIDCDTRASVICGDSLRVMPTLAAESFDSIVTDPPYGLVEPRSGGNGLGQAFAARSESQKAKRRGGFMGKAWDAEVPGVPFWTEALRVAKPGAHLLAFGGTRTSHRLTCAIEDAGWEIRDCIMWVYGSGFPKSHNLDGQWQGWGTALKPAFEPIIVARKPLIGTVAENVLRHGTGALNIDACRVGFMSELDRASAFPGGRLTSHGSGSLAGPGSAQDASRSGFDAKQHASGRWPANLIHDGSDEVVGLFPDSKGQQGDVRGNEPSGVTDEIYGKFAGRVPAAKRGDSGSAARFFYCAKASKSDRGEGNNHPTVKPTSLMEYLIKLVTPPGGHVLDPFGGSGTTAVAAKRLGFRCTAIELNNEYCEIIRRRVERDHKDAGLFAGLE